MTLSIPWKKDRLASRSGFVRSAVCTPSTSRPCRSCVRRSISSSSYRSLRAGRSCAAIYPAAPVTSTRRLAISTPSLYHYSEVCSTGGPSDHLSESGLGTGPDREREGYKGSEDHERGTRRRRRRHGDRS